MVKDAVPRWDVNGDRWFGIRGPGVRGYVSG
jgi:hypothetical protein